MENQNDQNRIAEALESTGASLREEASIRNEVMRRVHEHASTGRSASPPLATRTWRLVRRIGAVAACLLIALFIWSPWSSHGLGAQQAFAAAIAKVESAGTFACRQISTHLNDNNEVETHVTDFLYREPHLERIDRLEGPGAGEYMITDYDQRKRLVVQEDDQSAQLQDISDMYQIDPDTGRVKHAELGNNAREDIFRIASRAVKDLGMTELNGREAWLLQSDDGGEAVRTVWLDPETGNPVQVEIARPELQQSFMYTDIRIDEPIDGSNFDLSPPEGYAYREYKPADEHYGKLAAKMMHVLRECHEYRSKNDQFPASLDDLIKNGMDAATLRTLLAPPDDSNGKPVMIYRPPVEGADWGTTILLYEAPHSRQGGRVAAGFTDGHVELMNLDVFEAALKK